MLESKHYYVDLINSSKAYQFTAFYHYSGVGFKKAKINQGIFRKSDNLLVGVLQWGCSAQEGIRLDRYVKEPITKEEYLELNRFCMADSEGKNAESEAIALGIKWIRENRKDIRLLVSYAGRKEGNYGYIYQATNWEYLGYFLSPGFWLVNGQERHQITLWFAYKRHCDTTKPFTQGLCELYDDLRQTTTKQFIYIQRLDRNLTPATELLAYPKPSTDFPICTKVNLLKDGGEICHSVSENQTQIPTYYYEKETNLFVVRGGKRKKVAIYDMSGDLESVVNTFTEASELTGIAVQTISNATKSKKEVKGYSFRSIDDEALAHIDDTPYICIIDGVKFAKQIEIAEYCGVTKQAVSSAKDRQQSIINGKEIQWNIKE